SPEGDALLARLGAEPVRGSLGDAASLRKAVAGCQAVFHTAADTSTWAPGDAAQTDTNVGGTVRLLAASRDAGVSAFLHTSSVSAYSHLVHGTLREDVPQRGGDRKSTRLNSSHVKISYAVFCLKKKNTT